MSFLQTSNCRTSPGVKARFSERASGEDARNARGSPFASASKAPPDLIACLASAGRVPPFTLFEFVAFQLSDAFGANNVKSGTGVVDAATRP